MKEGTCLEGPVDGSAMDQNLVAATISTIVEGNRCLGTFLCQEFSLEEKILVVGLPYPLSLSLTDGKVADAA